MRAARGPSAAVRLRHRPCPDRRRRRRPRRRPAPRSPHGRDTAMPCPYLVDTHCHLGDTAFDADRDAVLARARAAGVSHVVVIGESLGGSERAVTLARGATGGGLSATAGVHPHEASSWSVEVAARLRELLAAPEVVAVGETGL